MPTIRDITTWVPLNNGDSGAFVLGADIVNTVDIIVEGVHWYQMPNGVISPVESRFYDETNVIIATGSLAVTGISRPNWNYVPFVAEELIPGDGQTRKFAAAISGEQGWLNPGQVTYPVTQGNVQLLRGCFGAGTGTPTNTWDGLHGVALQYRLAGATVILVPATLTLVPQAVEPEALPATVDLVPATLTLVPQPVTPEEAGDVVVDSYQFGPCSPWTPIFGCDPPVTGATLDAAVAAASEVLYHLTAQRFGTCDIKLRPCRRSCYGGLWPYRDWWEWGTWPQPVLYAGTWYNITCGNCGDTCSCTPLHETVLPGPVASIIEVKLNGTILTPNVDYRLDEYRKLVRLGGLDWPFCQDLNLADTEDNTWSVTARLGEVVPTIGQLAVGELATEFANYLCGNDCALPRGVVDISRQGISMTIARVSELFSSGFINLPLCDMFIQAANPKHHQARSAVYDIDSPNFRIVGT